jgi:hypothetical protein
MAGPPRRLTPHAGVVAAARVGRLELLIALRELIAARIDSGVQPSDLNALVRVMVELTRSIEALGANRDRDRSIATDVPE